MMFCEKCGAQNTDGAKFCSGCGAPLNSADEPVYQAEPQAVQYRYAAQAPERTRSVASMVIYFISGGVAVWTALLIFIPHIVVGHRFFNIFQIIESSTLVSYITGGNSDGDFIVSIFIVPFFIALALQVVWAILSFVRVKAAGVLGLIASIIYINHSVVWMIMLTTSSIKEPYVVTPVPYLMVTLGIAGMVLSVLQLAKRKTVR